MFSIFVSLLSFIVTYYISAIQSKLIGKSDTFLYIFLTMDKEFNLYAFLRCPISKTALRLDIITEYSSGEMVQNNLYIKEGLLFSPIGFVFPIIDGIPRMLIESMIDYASFMKKHLPSYDDILKKIELEFPSIIGSCLRKNAKTKKSFAFEWGHLKPEENDKIWNVNLEDLQATFLKETEVEAGALKNKMVIDIGSGHGEMTKQIGDLANVAIGVELSLAIEDAQNRNDRQNVYFVQADLQFLPFETNCIDLLYSSGVLHHTSSTELSFFNVESIIAPQGKICLWLYHPRKNFFHNCSIFLRKFTTKMPLSVLYTFLAIFVLPPSYIIKKIKRSKDQVPNLREEMIDLLDGFSPEFREEVEADIAKTWLLKTNYEKIKVTTQNKFGYSIVGIKSNHKIS